MPSLPADEWYARRPPPAPPLHIVDATLPQWERQARGTRQHNARAALTCPFQLGAKSRIVKRQQRIGQMFLHGPDDGAEVATVLARERQRQWTAGQKALPRGFFMRSRATSTVATMARWP
ncbi:MAG: hypothetical protein R3E50_05470 [Halioglobus sp.]